MKSVLFGCFVGGLEMDRILSGGILHEKKCDLEVVQKENFPG